MISWNSLYWKNLTTLILSKSAFLLLDGAAWIVENDPANKTDVSKETVALSGCLITSICTPLCDTQKKSFFAKKKCVRILPSFNYRTESRLGEYYL